MIIRVTKEDIINGESGSCDNCPIARAIIRTFNIDDVAVDATYIDIEDRVYRTPVVAAEFIYNFDDGKTVEPFDFELGKQL